MDVGASALARRPEVRTCRATDRPSGRDRRDRRCAPTAAPPREATRSAVSSECSVTAASLLARLFLGRADGQLPERSYSEQLLTSGRIGASISCSVKAPREAQGQLKPPTIALFRRMYCRSSPQRGQCERPRRSRWTSRRAPAPWRSNRSTASSRRRPRSPGIRPPRY